MLVTPYFDDATKTFTYLVADEATNKCLLIDTVLDYCAESGKTSTTSIDKILQDIDSKNLQLEWVLETHIHADHLTAASYLRKTRDIKIGIGDGICGVIDYWAPVYNMMIDVGGNQFDALLSDNEIIRVGELDINVLHTPGHTPACVSYLIGDSVFVGDSLFNPSMGTARADFPGGSANLLYRSIQRLYELDDSVKVYVGHDYPKAGEAPIACFTIFEHKSTNAMIAKGVSEQEYVSKRETRDATLAVPKLLLPAIQVNMRAGYMGPSEANGVRYLKIPLNQI